MRNETHQQFQEWLGTLRRGKNRISYWKSNPQRRADPALEAIPFQQVGGTLDRIGATSELIRLPDFLKQTVLVRQQDLKGTSARRRYQFIGFPAEVRNHIYDYCVDYPTCRKLFKSYYSPSGLRLQTPTVLLLCKQITREALSILRTRCFVLDSIPPWLVGHPSPLPVTSFVSIPTLESIRYMEIRIAIGEGNGSGKIWRRVLEKLLDAIKKHSLLKLKVTFKLWEITRMPQWYSELHHWQQIFDRFQRWELMTFNRGGRLQFEYWLIDGIYAYRHNEASRIPVVRRYPDGDFWDGSVLQFV